jgi:3-oxoacyl-[acyl-carrier-protein] synthase-3
MSFNNRDVTVMINSQNEDAMEKRMVGKNVYLAGIGSFSPGDPVPFDKIEDVLGRITDAPEKLLKRIDRMRPIMKEMLGVEYSHYALDPNTRQITETNVSMSVKAANKALEMANMNASQIDLIVYAGIFFDHMCPPTSVFVQEALNIPHCAEISIHSNCTAIYKALQVASDLIACGRYKNAIVVTSQLSSPFLQAEYFNQKVMTEEQVILRWFLSDGAGALVLSSNKPAKPCLKVLDTYLESVGVGLEPAMKMLIGASRSNVLEIYKNGWHHLTQDLKTVAKLAPELGRKGFRRMRGKCNFDPSKIKCFFLNIPTKHLMDTGVEIIKTELNNPDLYFYTKLSTRGYPGAPAIIIALDEYLHETSLNPGDLLVSFVTESSKWMHAGFILEYSE